jgi:hypothetical protein
LSGSSSELDSDFWNNLNSSDDDDWEWTPPPSSMSIYRTVEVYSWTIEV